MNEPVPWFAPFIVLGALFFIGFYFGCLYQAWRMQTPGTRWKPTRELPPMSTPPFAPEPPVAIGARFWCLSAQLLCVEHRLPNGQPGMHCTANDGRGVLVDLYFSPGMYEALKIELARNIESGAQL